MSEIAWFRQLPLFIDMAILAITLYTHPPGARNRCCEEFCWSSWRRSSVMYLTACSGYVLYTISEGRSEAHLSLMVRFLFNPLIALAVGVLVGLLSSDHPALTSVVGLTPWALMLRGPGRGGSVSGLRAFLGGMLVYFALGAVAAAFAWRLRHKSAD